MVKFMVFNFQGLSMSKKLLYFPFVLSLAFQSASLQALPEKTVQKIQKLEKKM
jgi:hypothetical protein